MQSVRFARESFSRFIGELPLPLRVAAFELEPLLELSGPAADPLTTTLALSAPALIGPSMPRATRAQIEQATTAHFFATLVGEGCLAVLDEQLDATPSLLSVLALARRKRDAALAVLVGNNPAPSDDFADAASVTFRAAAQERAILRSGEGTFVAYEWTLSSKQSLRAHASSVLARVVDLPLARRAAIRRLIESLGAALDIARDLVTWEQSNESWAAALAHGDPDGRVSLTQEAGTAARVRESGVLPRMAEYALDCMTVAASAASDAGAEFLAMTLKKRAEDAADIAEREIESPGWLAREQALSHWAHAVGVYGRSR